MWSAWDAHARSGSTTAGERRVVSARAVLWTRTDVTFGPCQGLRGRGKVEWHGRATARSFTAKPHTGPVTGRSVRRREYLHWRHRSAHIRAAVVAATSVAAGSAQTTREAGCTGGPTPTADPAEARVSISRRSGLGCVRLPVRATWRRLGLVLRRVVRLRLVRRRI